MTVEKVIECKSKDGITIGLIDSIMTTARVIRERLRQYIEADDNVKESYDGNYGFPKSVEEALLDLQGDNDLYLLLQSIGYNPRILSETDRKIMDQTDKTLKLLRELTGIE